jgi:hypothetical protein
LPEESSVKSGRSCVEVPSRYVLALELYTGKIGNVVQRNLATNVVLRLIDQLPNDVKQGRNVIYDRYFTDHLAQALFEQKMTSLGVVDHKRSFIPPELRLIRNNLYSSWFYFSGSTTLLSYQSKEKNYQLYYYQHYMIFLKY